MTHVCIGNRRGNRGVVYAPDGTIIGRIESRARVAAGAKGARAPFFTAYVALPDGATVGHSLGTRHRTRASAARAIRLFWQRNSGTTAPRDPFFVSRLTARFKSEYWRDCALPYQTIKPEALRGLI
jgi:hypothetical protein